LSATTFEENGLEAMVVGTEAEASASREKSARGTILHLQTTTLAFRQFHPNSTFGVLGKDSATASSDTLTAIDGVSVGEEEEGTEGRE